MNSLRVNQAGVGEEAPGPVDGLLVQGHQPVYCVLPDLKTGQMGQEVIADEEAHENPIIDGSLEIVGKGQVGHLQVSPQVLSKHRETNKDELLLFPNLSALSHIILTVEWLGCSLTLMDLVTHLQGLVEYENMCNVHVIRLKMRRKIAGDINQPVCRDHTVSFDSA